MMREEVRKGGGEEMRAEEEEECRDCRTADMFTGGQKTSMTCSHQDAQDLVNELANI